MLKKKIVYCETKNEVDLYLNNRKGHTDEAVCLALKPSVRVYALEKGIQVESTLPYLDNESHAQLSRISRCMSEWVGERAVFTDTPHNLRSAYGNIVNLWLRFAINYCLWSIEIASNAAEAHKAQVLSAAVSSRIPTVHCYEVPELGLFVQPQENRFGELLRRLAQKKGLEFEPLHSGGMNRSSLQQWFLHFHARWLSILRYVYYRLEHNRALKEVAGRKKAVVFLTTSVAYMENLERYFKQQGDYVFYRLPESWIPTFPLGMLMRAWFRKHAGQAARQTELLVGLSDAIRKEKELFSHRGISFADIIADKVSRDIAPYMGGLILWTAELDRALKAVTPSLVLSSGNRSDDPVIGELCLKNRIPAVFISHGSFVHPKSDIEEIEWGEQGKNFLRAPFSFIALQSPLAEGYLKVFPPCGRPVKTGPLIWGMPVDRNKSREFLQKMFGGRLYSEHSRVIVHAGTPKASNSLRFYIYETPDEYVESIRDVAAAVERLPDVILIVRFRPSEKISISDLKKLIPFSDRIALSTDGAFGEILGMADVLVSFSSTTIEEALQNRVPVLQYGGGGRYQHIPGYEISSDRPFQPSAVYHVKEAGGLVHALNEILRLDQRQRSNEELFNRYIYSRDVRTSLTELI